MKMQYKWNGMSVCVCVANFSSLHTSFSFCCSAVETLFLQLPNTFAELNAPSKFNLVFYIKLAQ